MCLGSTLSIDGISLAAFEIVRRFIAAIGGAFFFAASTQARRTIVASSASVRVDKFTSYSVGRFQMLLRYGLLLCSMRASGLYQLTVHRCDWIGVFALHGPLRV